MTETDERPDSGRAATCAALMIEIAPLVLRAMRKELAAHEGVELSVPQFRALRFVGRRPGDSLSDLAEHLGTSRPAASKLADRLAEVGLLTRATDPGDRRQALLSLTDRGRGALQAAHDAAEARLAERLAQLAPDDLELCAQALGTLRDLFAAGSQRDR